MSNRNTDSLFTLADAVRRRAPVLKPYLPPCGLVLAFDTGAVITASGIPINTVMEANAAQRALYQFLRDHPGEQPRIVAAAAAGARGENACMLADLLNLAAFSDGNTVFTYRQNDGSVTTMTDLSGQFSHLPQAAPRLLGADAGGYTLRLTGTATTREGATVDLGGMAYPDFQLTAAPDPTDLTPARAFVADLYEQFQAWTIDAIILSGTGRDGDFPLSGRDLQVLRRTLPETTPVIWNGVHDTLASLMPGAYQSNYTLCRHESGQPFWQDVPVAALAETLGGAVFEQAVADVIAFAKTAPVQPPRAAAVILASGRVVCAAHVPLHGLNVPSCAESHALRRAMSEEPNGRITAMVLLMHENHTDTPLLGVEAAPCGFCRTCISAVCDGDTPIILTDGLGNFQWAQAGNLLKYQILTPRFPAAVAAAGIGNGDCLSVVTLRTGRPDCEYPPAIGPELAYRGGLRAERLLVFDPDPLRAGQVGAYARHWLAKAAATEGNPEILFDVPDGPLPEPLPVEKLFGNLRGFDFAANGQFVDGRSLNLQHHAVIAGENVGR